MATADVPAPEQIEMVVDFTGFQDRSLIKKALKAHHGDANSVVLEYFDGEEKVGPFRSCRLSRRRKRAPANTPAVQAQVWLG